jgi:DedD protein
MRAAQMYEEEEEIRESGADLQLGMGSLIGIFFGLALVCGVFFGFGYTMGHRTPGAYVSSEPLYESRKPQLAAVAPKPSAQVPVEPSDAARVVVPASVPASTQPQADQVAVARVRESASPAATTPSPAVAPKPQPVAVVAKATASAPPAAAEPATARPTVVPPPAVQPSTGTIMVQIAAVKNRSDAEALAAALQKNGFNATVRTEAQDKLLHVQVGPFDNRDEAKAMRQKLANAGYNAFIK